MLNRRIIAALAAGFAAALCQAQPILPSKDVLERPFSDADIALFKSPQRVFYPEIWIECLSGNLSKEGITADLESIKEAGFAGVQMFFGNQGDPWPGVKQITSLSPEWEEFVQFAAEEASRLGLRFTLQNCPGWAMAGGPWITPDKAMRHLVWTTVTTSDPSAAVLPLPAESEVDWRDYQDVMVLAFPTPEGEKAGALEYSVTPQILGNHPQTNALEPHVFDIVLDEAQTVRTVEFSSVQLSNHWYCYDPGIHGRMEAVYPDGSSKVLFDTDWPQSNWQDDRPLSLACDEVPATDHYRLAIANTHASMALSSFRLLSAARKNGWESEAGWSLRSILRNNDEPLQDAGSWVSDVRDITSCMRSDGSLDVSLPEGEWTILRIGNVNTGKKNGPAPAEATGFECDKFSFEGADSHFAGYVGKLVDGRLNGLLDGMLMDSWECETQTWTKTMEQEFKRVTGYDIRPWMPALMGYVVKDPETTARFLRDWRSVINDLVVNKFYGRMTDLAHSRGLTVTYETSSGDVFPSDIMEYFKFADVPMCEFWVHDPDIFVGTFNFKPIRPTASAAHLYGKPRVAAEAFTSMQQTWDEQLSALRERANKNFIHGASYFVYQAYTHNPAPGRLVPGSSFGIGIGTPFLRSQTWWRHIGAFNDCTARTSFLLERGRPVSDVLWYLGDEIDHKPDQNAPFPSAYRYDYCNPDVLLNRLSVKDGCLVTPEGIQYRVLWIPESRRCLPETVEKMLELVREGATIVGDAPLGLATLSDPDNAGARLKAASDALWGFDRLSGIRSVGKGRVVSGYSIGEALKLLGIAPDLQAEGLQWLHRQIDGADWYYVCPEPGKTFQGKVRLRASGEVELWNPVDGSVQACPEGMELSLAKDETRFIVVRNDSPAMAAPVLADSLVSALAVAGPWTLDIPDGWGQDAPVKLDALAPLKDLPLSDEARAFSGTCSYSTTFRAGKLPRDARMVLDLGYVANVARVVLNGHDLGSVWTAPYSVDVTGLLRKGKNKLTIEVTNTWFNRLAYDILQDEGDRKTWSSNYPAAGSPLRDSGLVGPVSIRILE
ncbi:MAG: hypothetical protein MJY86_01440 [Bacteroidales bacterium]|nr:hypothetical protein [Bacteroidales bacterium]